MQELYPALTPYATHRLPVDDRHTLYVEECGRPDGLPVVFLHGGPGAGCEAYHRRFFDPEVYRIVLFDQRGCGRSTPYADLVDNTTWHLVGDIERVRVALGIGRWLVFGGSWGATLGLVYAQTHPGRVLGLVVRGTFLCRPCDIRWFYQAGAHRIRPDSWEAFIAPIPQEERGDLVAAYYRRLTGDDEAVMREAARAWSVWEGSAATLLPNRAVVDFFGHPRTAVSLARIECHYFMHHCFLELDQLLRDAPSLARIPGWITHGRYDIVCPLEQAWRLHQAWPQAHFDVISDAGHAAGEPGIRDSLLRATRAMAERLA